MVSDSWLEISIQIQSNLWIRPPKGLGVCGPISPVVSFARFGSKNFNMKLYTCPRASHRHQPSAVPTCTRGRNWQRPRQEELTNANIARLECLCRKSWWMEKVFFAQFDACGRFSQVESTLWADLRCPQFAFLRWSHFQESTPYIWIPELKGLKVRVRNFQVVAFVRWSQGQVRLYQKPRSLYWKWSKLTFSETFKKTKSNDIILVAIAIGLFKLRSLQKFNREVDKTMTCSALKIPLRKRSPPVSPSKSISPAKKKLFVVPAAEDSASPTMEKMFATILERLESLTMSPDNIVSRLTNSDRKQDETRRLCSQQLRPLRKPATRHPSSRRRWVCLKKKFSEFNLTWRLRWPFFNRNLERDGQPD